MIDFSEMPVQDGIRGCYDYIDYDGGAALPNKLRSDGIALNLMGASQGEGCVFLPRLTGAAYLADSLDNNFTVYTIIKGDVPTGFSGTTWGIAACGANSSYRVFMGQYTSGNVWQFFTNSSNPVTNVNCAEYHVLAMSVCSGLQKMYVDGILIATDTLVRDYAVKGLYVNTGEYNGNTPAASQTYSADMYLKFLAYAVDNHSDAQILRNSKWLLEQYGFAGKPLDSRMSGADAAVIAWCIAKSEEQSRSFDLQKKAYRKATVKGDSEDYTTSEDGFSFGVNEDNTSTDIAATDLTKGFYAVSTDDDGSITGYARIWFEPYYNKNNQDTVRKDMLMFAVYDSSGELISENHLGALYRELLSYVGYDTIIYKIKLYKNGRYEAYHTQKRLNTGEISNGTTIGMTGFSDWSYVTNVPPI